jgi:NADPH2:quinone reductase
MHMRDAVPRQMRAAVIVSPRKLEVRTVETPQPTAGQVLIRVAGCGVCGSNLPGVTDVGVGDRVAFLSNAAFAEYDVSNVDSILPLPAVVGDRDMPGEALVRP